MHKRTCESLSKKYFEQIKAKYGMSKYKKDFPVLVFNVPNYPNSTDEAYYDSIDNEICVHYNNIESEIDLIKVLLHEFKHFLQSPTWFTRYYDMGYKYDDHPYEIAAKEFEKEYINFLN